MPDGVGAKAPGCVAVGPDHSLILSTPMVHWSAATELCRTIVHLKPDYLTHYERRIEGQSDPRAGHVDDEPVDLLHLVVTKDLCPYRRCGLESWFAAGTHTQSSAE